MIGITHGYPVFTFQSPGDRRYAQRTGLVKADMSVADHKKLPVWQFGHSGKCDAVPEFPFPQLFSLIHSSLFFFVP